MDKLFGLLKSWIVFVDLTNNFISTETELTITNGKNMVFIQERNSKIVPFFLQPEDQNEQDGKSHEVRAVVRVLDHRFTDVKAKRLKQKVVAALNAAQAHVGERVAHQQGHQGQR